MSWLRALYYFSTTAVIRKTHAAQCRGTRDGARGSVAASPKVLSLFFFPVGYILVKLEPNSIFMHVLELFEALLPIGFVQHSCL